MEVDSLEIPDVKLIKPRVFPDERGFFQQCYHAEQYREVGIDVEFVQDNWSRSKKGVLRGLHYQLEYGQDKLLYVAKGEVFDVAVDIRRGSPTFGQWVGARLSSDNHNQLFVPKGFAHGFCVLSEEVDFFYKCSDFYAPRDEYAIRWNDPDIGIDWPDLDMIISAKDQKALLLKDCDHNDLPAYRLDNR